MELELPPNGSMRDIHDLCTKHGLPSLAQGMIELAPPEELRTALGATAMEEQVHQYRARWGDDKFREAIVATLAARGEAVEVANVLTVQGVTGGVCAGLLYARKVAMDEGRTARVALLEPFYTYHKQQVEAITGNAPVYVPCKSDLTPDLDALETATKDGLDAVIVCNPSNPTGRMWTAEELERLSKMNVLKIYDEVYCEMVFGEKHASVTHLLSGDSPQADQTICVRSFSKCVGCQSWRVGYCLSSAAMIQKLMPVMDPLYICTPITQIAIANWLVADKGASFESHTTKVNELLRANWADLAPAFAKRFGWRPIEPEGTMYGCFWHDGETDLGEAGRCLKEAKVGVCPGNIFMKPGTQSKFIRIHCGVSREKCAQVVQNLSQ